MIRVIIGLVSLGLVVLVHEIGHYIAARLSGVDVETFSIGWGPVLFRKKKGDTEWRVSALPIGGYCGMKGEHAFREAVDKGLSAIPREEGSFFTARPLRRIAIAFAGPFFNLLFAVLVFSVSSSIGHSYVTHGNRVIPAYPYDNAAPRAGLDAGLLPGDEIIALDGKPMETFSDIQQYVGMRAERPIEATVKRPGSTITLSITPELDKKTGAGRIGIYPFIPLIVGSVKPGSSAETSGLRAGDSIVACDGRAVSHHMDLVAALSHKPEQTVLTVIREGIEVRVPLVLLYREDGSVETGITWKAQRVTVAGTNLVDSVRNGVITTGKTLALTVKGIGLLFKGVDVSEAVSGPVRITLMIGEVAETSLTGVAELLGIICVSLFLMNLLPVPILDGGLILMSVIELVKGSPLRPKTLYRVQFIGVAFILAVFAFALFGDIHYLLQ
jgi:regulator of sigma E protease